MEFNESDERFKVLNLVHVKYVTLGCAIIGVIATCAIFGFGVIVYPWALYEKSVNFTAMTAFVCFLTGGLTVHFLIIYGVKTIRFRYMIPSIIYHAFLMGLNGITTLIAIGELVSEGDLSPRDDTMARIVICTCPPIFMLQTMVLTIIGKCRLYIQCKRRHIRNGLPPPIREVIFPSINGNKISSTELSIDNSFRVAETMMP